VQKLTSTTDSQDRENDEFVSFCTLAMLLNGNEMLFRDMFVVVVDFSSFSNAVVTTGLLRWVRNLAYLSPASPGAIVLLSYTIREMWKRCSAHTCVLGTQNGESRHFNLPFKGSLPRVELNKGM
jgi:hypothetical protein